MPSTDLGRIDCTPLYPTSAGGPHPPPPPPTHTHTYPLPSFFFLSRTEEPPKVGTCSRDRRALQQLALNVHVKHFEPDPMHAEPAPMAQWLCHLLMGWLVLGSHLGTGSNPERDFKGPVGRCKATTPSCL